MNKDEIDKRIDNIIENLDSTELHFQSIAIDAFNDLLINETLSIEQKERIIPYLEKLLHNPNSAIRTECFKCATLIGRRHFDLIKDIFPILIDELSLKDRFRSELLVDMLIDLRNLNNPVIQNSIRDLIQKAPEWFSESHLTPIIVKFWEHSVGKTFQFIDNYIQDIKDAVINYPESFSKIKELINKKLEEYREYLEEIKLQQERERKLREEEEKKREKLRKKEEERLKQQEIEKIAMKKKLEEYIKSISEKKMDGEHQIVKMEQIIEESNDPTIINRNGPESNQIEQQAEESSSFITFTKLGLKRKEIEKKEEE